jgi:hypothetical protein
MTDEEVLKHYERMAEIFGDKIPHPDHEPKQFAYFVKLYRYYYVKTN